MTETAHTESSNNLGSKTKESIIWFTTLPMALQIFRLASSIILARILNPKDFGIVGIASIIVYYTNNLSSFGLGNAIVQRKEIDDDHLNTFFTVNLGVSLILCFLFIAAAKSISLFFNMKELTNVILVLSSIFIITSFYTIPYTKLRRDLGFKAIAKNDATKILVSIPLSLLLAIKGYGYWSLILAMLVSSLIATITISWRAKITYKLSFTLKAFKDLLNYASWNFFSLQIRLLSEYIDKLIIGKLSGATILGYYEKSFGLSQMPYDQMVNKLKSIFFSTFSRCQGDLDELRYYFRRTLVFLTFLAFPVYLGLLSVAKPFVIVLLGSKWSPMIACFQILLVAFLASSLSSLFSTLNVTCGSYKNDTRLRALCLAGLIIALPFAARYSITAVAAVVFVHNTIFLILAVGLSCRVLYLSWRDVIFSILPAATGSLLLFITVKVVSIWFFVTPSILGLSLQILTGFMVYTVWFFCTNFRQWKYIKKKLFSMSKKIYPLRYS